jgi:PhnB protein
MTMKEANAYLIFDGNCGEAMKFYGKCLEAELQMMRFGDMPGGCPEGMKEGKDRIMHARLTKGGAVLMASDNMPGMPFQQGNNFSIALNCESPQEVDRYFAALGEKGKVTMPVQETFWAARFGMLTDQFGTNWMLNLDKPK